MRQHQCRARVPTVGRSHAQALRYLLDTVGGVLCRDGGDERIDPLGNRDGVPTCEETSMPGVTTTGLPMAVYSCSLFGLT